MSRTIYDHETVHLIFKVEDGREIHTHIPWATGRALPQAEAILRLEKGFTVAIMEVVVNAFPIFEGDWADLHIFNQLSENDRLLPLSKSRVEEVLDRLALKHY